MQNVTLISSFHKIHGKCNPEELYKIIDDLKPEVIFEELSNEWFRIVYSEGYQPQSVEAISIKNYLKQNSIKHFPVDNYPKRGSDFISDIRVVWDRNEEYRNLWNKKMLKIYHEGYLFINSNECDEILARISEIEECVFAGLKDTSLWNAFLKEKELHHNREIDMLNNIYSISAQQDYNQAVFICGVDHRRAFKNKIKDVEISENTNVNWLFFNE